MQEHLLLIEEIVNLLKEIPSIKAIVLGGSHATGTNHENSDIDLGIFYRENDPLQIDKITRVATILNDDKTNVSVSSLGIWGKWVNGGAWLTIKNQRVDFIYRNLDFVEKIINLSKNGYFEFDYYQQPAFGFYSYIYCAEIYYCKILYDPEKSIQNLKEEIQVYPIELKKSIFRNLLWDAEFTSSYLEKEKIKNNYILFSGCSIRIINNLIQVLYALNEKYFINEKQYLNDINNFTNKPENFIKKTENILKNLSTEETIQNLNNLINEIKIITKDYYSSPFNLP